MKIHNDDYDPRIDEYLELDPNDSHWEKSGPTVNDFVKKRVGKRMQELFRVMVPNSKLFNEKSGMII